METPWTPEDPRPHISSVSGVHLSFSLGCVSLL